MVGSIPQNSVLDDEGIPESPLPASPEYRIPETPPRMHVPPPLLGLAAKQRSANIELPNDPISEFVSQREGSPGLAPASPEHADTYAGNTSITQWYHDNLTKDDSADDGLGLGCPSDADSLAHEEPAQATGEQASDDGYSSPLEGFWDLRRNGQDGGSDRDMYIHQFESSVRSKPPSQGKASQLAVRAPPPPLPPALPPRPVQRGRKTAAYPGWHQNNAVRPLVSSRPPQTAATRTPAWRRGNAVRPLSSSYLAQKPAVRPPAMPHYNYYADDPFLDVGGSLNWEGGGMSRFG
ncbi:hypothetical protein GGF46_003151 [Coemansia sp. RSA 552]|nr:hypothetical protein GGF46_003151 [Coemansia sp. RSA 552]